jgi:hypothetical protein
MFALLVGGSFDHSGKAVLANLIALETSVEVSMGVFEITLPEAGL